jgi:hypothetical protein
MFTVTLNSAALTDDEMAACVVALLDAQKSRPVMKA